MKHHQILALGACALGLALTPASARAEPPPGATERHPDMKHGRPGEHPGRPDGKPGDHAGMPGGKGEQGEHGRPGDDDQKPGDTGKPEGGRGERFHGAMRELREELKSGKLKKEDLKARLAKLRETSGERGKQHRQELGKRWGGTLAQPSAVEELKQHARRMAFLDRAMLLAETDAKDKPKLSERISKLIDKENARHESAMERLKTMPPPPAPAAGAPSAAPAAAAAPAGSAASDVKGDAK